MNSWWQVAFSGFGVTTLTIIGTAIYRYFKKHSSGSDTLTIGTASQNLIDSKVYAPVAGRDVNIGRDLHITTKDVELLFHAPKPENPAPSPLGIVGSADLLIQEIALSDIKIEADAAYYEVDVAAFARMEIASLDKPRTIKYFEMEMTAPDGTKYRAKSEYQVGSYDYVYELKKKDTWGMTSRRTVREPMENLAAKVRTPIQPSTHVGRAWVRFEIPAVRQGHEPANCQIKIWAVDPADQRHEIRTDEMRIARSEDRHYVSAHEQC